MKKTSMVFLTLIMCLSITISSAQSDSLVNKYPDDFLLETEKYSNAGRDSIRRDSVRRDTVRQVQVTYVYDYYYRNRFFNNLFMWWNPVRYQYLISRPGYRPRHIRGGDHFRGPHSTKRGGFGYTGSHHTQHN